MIETVPICFESAQSTIGLTHLVGAFTNLYCVQISNLSASQAFPVATMVASQDLPASAVEQGEDPDVIPFPAESFGGEVKDLDQTLWDLFSSTAARYPDRDAVVSMWQPEKLYTREQSTPADSKYLRWSYLELYQRGNVLAQWLEEQGCQTNTRLAAFLWNSVEWGLFFWSSAKLGATYVPLDPRILAIEGDKLLATAQASIVVAQDAEGAVAIDEKLGPVIRIQCTGNPVPGWTQLSDILGSVDVADHEVEASSGRGSAGDTALIVFTSGTTSTPKGCPHTHSGLVAQTNLYDPNEDPTFVDRWLMHTPTSHIFAINNALRAWRLGFAVILPSRAFDVQATLRALVDERGTVMSAVPTLVKALIGNPLFPGKDKLNLKLVTIGGTIVTPEDIRLCQDGLGADHAVQGYGLSEGAPVISWNRPDATLRENKGYHPGVGRVLPGVNLRVCAPGSREPLSRGEVGELHIGGPAVITGYLNGVDAHSFYTDKAGSWLMTGDQARMDSDGIVYIIGRYKDVIIRGGENISPTKLEMVIGEIPGVIAQVVGVPDDLAGQLPVGVVKLPEGVEKKEVMAKCRKLGPMYVLDSVYTLSELGLDVFPITSLGKVKKEVLRQAVLKVRAPPKSDHGPQTVQSCGENEFAKLSGVAGIRTPADNGKSEAGDQSADPGAVDEDQTPKDVAVDPEPARTVTSPDQHNASGNARVADAFHSGEDKRAPQEKVDSVENLQTPVPDRSDAPSSTIQNSQSEAGDPEAANAFTTASVTERLAEIWESLIGEKPRLHDSVKNFADSITLLRFCDRVQTTFGQRIFIQDVIHHDTLEKQAALVEGRSPTRPAQMSNGTGQGDGNNHSQHSLATQQQNLPQAAIWAANAAGFSSESIEYTLLIRDGFHFLAAGNRPQTYHIRILFRIHDISPDQIRRGIEAALPNRPIFRTILARFPDLSPLHVVMRPLPSVFKAMITTQPIADEAEAFTLAKDGSATSHTSPLMARFTILTTVQENSPTYLLATYNHSILDALSILSWHLDLQRLIRNPDTAVPPLTCFTLYSDVWHQLQDSLSAQESVAFQVQRLRGISRFKGALWPPQRAPGWMVGNEDSEGSFAEERTVVREQVWAAEGGWAANLAGSGLYRNYQRVVGLHGLDQLKAMLGVAPALVMKAAVALFNVMQTGERFAIFSSLYAARRWPFVSGWLVDLLPPAMGLDGPTAEWAVEFIEVVRQGETVRDFLSRMKSEEEEVDKHVQAPLFNIYKGLGEEAAVVQDASMRQCFVWDVSLALGKGLHHDEVEKLEMAGRWDWPDW